MFDKESVNRIKENVDIVDIIREYVPTLKNTGRDYKALSPFTNEKTPSFIVSRNKQMFKDFSSGKGGDVIKFVQEFHNMSFNEAVEFLAEKIGLDLKKNLSQKSEFDNIENLRKSLNSASDFYHKQLLSQTNKAEKYLFDRGINQNSINEFQLGYATETWNGLYSYLKSNNFDDNTLIEAGLIKSKNGKIYDAYRDRLIFPIRDDLGRTIGLGGRIFEKVENIAKYINSPQNKVYDKSKVLYGLFESKREINNQDSAILVEGYFDVISLHQEGIKNVIASSGTALSQYQLKIISRYTKNLYIIYDSDKAGVNAANRVMDLAIEEGMNVKLVSLPDGEDPDSIIKNYGKNTFNKYLRDAIDFIKFRINSFGERTTPSQESELLRGLINSISKIPDKLQHTFYLNKVAEYLNLSEFQIENIYLEKNKLDKEIIRNEIINLQKVKINDAEAIGSIESFKNEISELDSAELQIFIYLIEHFENIEKIIEEFEFSEDLFLSELSTQIYRTLLLCEGYDLFEYLNQNEEIDVKIKEVIMGIPFSVDSLNVELAEMRKIKTEINSNSIKQAILFLKIKKLRMQEESIADKEDDDEVFNRHLEISTQIREFEMELAGLYE